MGTHCSCCHSVCHLYCFIVILIVSLTKLHLNVSHCFLLIVFCWNSLLTIGCLVLQIKFKMLLVSFQESQDCSPDVPALLVADRFSIALWPIWGFLTLPLLVSCYLSFHLFSSLNLDFDAACYYIPVMKKKLGVVCSRYFPRACKVDRS